MDYPHHITWQLQSFQSWAVKTEVISFLLARVDTQLAHSIFLTLHMWPGHEEGKPLGSKVSNAPQWGAKMGLGVSLTIRQLISIAPPARITPCYVDFEDAQIMQKFNHLLLSNRMGQCHGIKKISFDLIDMIALLI